MSEDHQYQPVDGSRGLEDQGAVLSVDDNVVVNDVAEVTRYKPKRDLKTSTGPKKTSEEYAYEALAADMDEWIIYDPDLDDLDEWLDTNLPSVLSREDHIGSICVKAIQDSDLQDSCNFELLHNEFKKLKESGKEINYRAISILAKQCNVVSGKWIFHVKTGCKVDIIWRKVAKGMIGGVLAKLATRANVIPREPDVDNFVHVVAVHHEDYTNENSVYKLNSALRDVGVKSKLLYKPDVYTHLGIYRNNEWKIRPSIYESTYDVLTKEHKVTPLYNKIYT